MRGTKIQRIAYSESTGTRVLTGQEGLLEVIGRRDRVHLSARRETAIGTPESGPPTPDRVRQAQATAAVAPAGSLREERADVADLAVPKTQPFTQGGSSLASTAGSMRGENRETRVEPVRPDPAPIDTSPTQPPPDNTPPPQIPPPVDAPPGRDVPPGQPPNPPPGDGTIEQPIQDGTRRTLP